ncbi:MAG: methyltransferase domain-containing protein [archaeon]|nr:methyltransferase domain-containing protein [archaeon]
MKKKDLINRLKSFNFPKNILDAFEKVDRSFFVTQNLKEEAYKDIPLPIGHNQTISQPYTIAFMLMLLEVRDGQKILEIGSGSGYVLSLLAEMNKNGEIYGVEKIKELAENSKEKLKKYKNVKVVQGDALNELQNENFDRIIASASFSELPQKIVNNQLKIKGILVAPVVSSIVVIKKGSRNKVEEYPGFSFVPIV